MKRRSVEMVDRFKTVLLFGTPGAGKGTQGKMLSNIPGFYHCASGDVFRRVDPHSKLGRVFYEYSSRGELVPDDVTVSMWDEAIHAHILLCDYRPHSDLLILDGIPRTPQQAELMDRYIEVLKVVHLTCDEPEKMFARLQARAEKEGRHDDADDAVIRRRWDVYEKETHPVLAHYASEVIGKVKAVGTPAEVLAGVLSILAPVQVEHFSVGD